MLKTLFNFTDDQLETNLKENIDPYWNISPREIMQFFGTEMMQYKIQEILPNIGKKFWINSLISRIQNNRKYVVSDLRFIHEHEELKKKNVFVIKITRPDNNNVNIDHISEQEYLNIPYDVHIVNNGTIDELLIKLDNALTIK